MKLTFEFLKKNNTVYYPHLSAYIFLALEQYEQIWKDINEAGENENISSHFIGSVVYEQDTYQISANTAMLVIDGQAKTHYTIFIT